MDKTKLLKNIFELAQQGIFIPVETLPQGISKEVVAKNQLYIELKELVKNGGSQERIEEIKAILNPQEEGDDV